MALTREPQGESRFYNGIWHVTLDGVERKLVRDMVLAFFWSPSGKEIAYVTTSEGAEGSVRWGLVDVESGDVRYLSDFRPTEEQLNVFMFFDQYVQSHNPWSPDGSALIYSGALGYTKGRDPPPGAGRGVGHCRRRGDGRPDRGHPWNSGDLVAEDVTLTTTPSVSPTSAIARRPWSRR